jgi:hypothetical protein
MEAARLASAADLPRLVELWRDVQEELSPMRGGQVLFAQTGRRQPIEASLAADLDDPSRGLWVGTIDQSPGHEKLLRGVRLYCPPPCHAPSPG